MNKSNLNFEQIVLSRSELRQLRKSLKGKALLSKCGYLKDLKLVDEEKVFNAGYMPVSTGFVQINQNGREYLAYIKRRKHEHSVSRWLSIIALVISLLTLLMQVLR